MGIDILFRFSDGSKDDVHFAGAAGSRQLADYGRCFHDCVTYGPETDEVYGPIRGTNGWYRPRTERCISRAEQLLELIGKTDTARRPPRLKERDLEMVGKLLRLLRRMQDDRRAMMLLEH